MAMGVARQSILEGIRRAVGRDGSPADAAAAVADRLARHPRGQIPAVTEGDHAASVALFIRKAEKAAATVERLESITAVPAAAARRLAEWNLPARLRLAPGMADGGIDWTTAPTLETTAGPSRGDDLAALNRALAGVAETGTLIVNSGVDSPTTLNFLPLAHLAVVSARDIVPAYEDAWDHLRSAGPLPRTVNMITGPSRTGDIEQTIQLGAHGPLRLHILLIDEG